MNLKRLICAAIGHNYTIDDTGGISCARCGYLEWPGPADDVPPHLGDLTDIERQFRRQQRCVTGASADQEQHRE